MSKQKTKTENKTEKALAAEKEQFNKQQVSVEFDGSFYQQPLKILFNPSRYENELNKSWV